MLQNQRRATVGYIMVVGNTTDIGSGISSTPILGAKQTDLISWNFKEVARVMYSKIFCPSRKMITMIPVLMIIASGIPSACKSVEKKEVEAAVIMRYEISGDSVYRVGERIEIDFTLYNHTDDSLFFLSWYTPFEGIKGKIFEVEFGGEELPYLGPMIKRGNPIFEDYIVIAPSDKIVTRVDLLPFYDFSIPGEYKVGFRGIVHDVRKTLIPGVQPGEPYNKMNITGNQIKFHIRE